MRIGDVIAMLAITIVILISVIVTGNLKGVADAMDLGAEGNATRTQLFTNAFTGLNLASVGIIVAAAVSLIALIYSSLGAGPRRQ